MRILQCRHLPKLNWKDSAFSKRRTTWICANAFRGYECSSHISANDVDCTNIIRLHLLHLSGWRINIRRKFGRFTSENTINSTTSSPNRVKLKPCKRELFKEKIQYLGFIVGTEGVSAVESKLKLIRDWAVPTSLKELRDVSVFINRHFGFCPKMALVAAQLARATCLNNVSWTREISTAFEVTKQNLVKVSTPVIMQVEGQLILGTYASYIWIGAVLLQDQNGIEKPIAYQSKALDTAERNYDVCEREMFALANAVKYFSLYLASSSLTVTTNNWALRWWRSMEVSPGSTAARWETILDSHKFEAAHYQLDKMQ